MLHKILGERLVGLHAVSVTDEVGTYVVDQTVILELKSGKLCQVVVDQSRKLVREMKGTEDIVFFGEYDDVESIELTPLLQGSILPEEGIFIQEVIEYWAQVPGGQFLMGVCLREKDGAELCIFTGGTEVELTAREVFLQALEGMLFTYDVHRFIYEQSERNAGDNEDA